MTERPSVEQRRAILRGDDEPEEEDEYGFRPRCNWGSGDLPSPYALGDLLWLPDPYEPRMRPELGDPGWYVVVSAYSIDEGDGWYFRVAQEPGFAPCSGRLYVVHAGQTENYDPADLMAPFELVDTADPEGLAERERLLADGWSYTPPEKCPTCNRRLP